MDDDETVDCGGCNEIIYPDEVEEEGWLLNVNLNDGTESGINLCMACAVRYLDVDDRMPIKTYETIRKIQTTI